MRLICPNCGAQYEVDGSVIPAGGRDVQCSNCGHTWFQRQPREEAEAAQPQTAPETPATQDPPQREPEPHAQPAAQAPGASPQAPAASRSVPGERDLVDAIEQPATSSETTSAAKPDTGPAPGTDGADEDGTASRPGPAAPQSTLDDGVANILREEAEREAQVRAARTAGLETQPDLGLDRPRDDTTHERAAQTHAPGDQADADGAGESATQEAPENSRRDLLPDIEEINSTLAATSDGAGGGTATADEARQTGFRRGVMLAFLLFAIMALVYVFAPKIADAVPSTAAALSAYVDWINGLRAGVDSVMLKAVDKLTGLLDQISGGTEG